jgi:hypothetical protein
MDPSAYSVSILILSTPKDTIHYCGEWRLNHIHMLERWHGHVLLSPSGSKIAILFFLVSTSTLVLLALRHVLLM